MKIIVIKIGGSIINQLEQPFFQTLAQLQKTGDCYPVIVHGGGPGINEALNKWEVSSSFVNGLRVTTKEVLEIAESVLSGTINKHLTAEIVKAGAPGFGLSGVDGSVLKVKPADPQGKLGYVGKVVQVNKKWLELIMDNGGIPVVSPIGIDEKGQRYNVNADMAAAAIAKELKAGIAFISDIPGVMEKPGDHSRIYDYLTKGQIDELIKEGVIHGGMIPKVLSALNALEEGVEAPVILNGLNPQDIVTYLKGEKAGTKIVMEEVHHA
ncbi:acetylglutamate kinase [Salipaludibacillus sp. CUR1]|uniref:acetylglutamate kinase n=1 Tax=Salipaludibacillus sp. CUR1 TaxID=2820003 RepID=UPI001E62124F|nr:acetylglutamate kinase [Salipaludibacillus sp. CUR1]MCE7791974.1 acetylglutamate kinase [Salipaludibacillus sp. CUR1]